jgi:hypothetical protein
MGSRQRPLKVGPWTQDVAMFAPFDYRGAAPYENPRTLVCPNAQISRASRAAIGQAGTEP